MGCSPCEQKRREREAEAIRLAAQGGETVPDVVINLAPACGYSWQQLNKWKAILDCAYLKEEIGNPLLTNAGVTMQQYGEYIGYINYTLEHIGDSECTYQEQLNNILPIIHSLVVLGC